MLVHRLLIYTFVPSDQIGVLQEATLQEEMKDF